MKRLLLSLLPCALLLPLGSLQAQTAAAPKPAAAQAGAKPVAQPARALRKAAPAAAAAATLPAAADDAPLNEGQLAAAGRVFTGRADCEFAQSVEVHPVSDRPGHFDVRFGKHSYRMVPQETTTGAVRLHDKRADVVWLQIPAKSMMMDQRAGRRMVDACLHAQQRAPLAPPTQVAEAEEPQAPKPPAATGLGIAVPAEIPAR